MHACEFSWHATMSSSIFRENTEKTERWVVTNMGRSALILLPSFCVILVFACFFMYPQFSFKTTTDRTVFSVESLNDDEECDLFKGHWIPDQRGTLYTNSSCSTIPESKNCIKQGRPDRDFLFWRWKPDDCDLPRLNPKQSLALLRGKKMTFVGDSVARNHMESLLCLLSMEETPKDVYKDAEDRNRIWYFPNHDFTLSTSWSKFLVTGDERKDENEMGTGLYDLDIAEIDDGWARDVPNTDIAIVSTAHWFFRPIVIHRGDETLGCIYCDLPNMTQISPKEALKLAYSSAFKYIEECKTCRENLVTIFRTFSPAHFENGTWNSGGGCKKTKPFTEDQIDLQSNEMGIRRSQIEQLNLTKCVGSKKFRVLDVTRAMLMRPDGHPDAYWGNKWMKGYNDCVHWCLPGPIDVWNDLLMAILIRL